jgi:tricorn protease
VNALWVSLLTPLLAAAPAPTPQKVLRHPTVSQTSIVFACGSDLWIVDRSGGAARRLTSDVGIEAMPYFSPDGSKVAFTAQYDGNDDVYVIPAAGGLPKRLTTHPSLDEALGWTRDGKRILFRSNRAVPNRATRLYTVGVEGGLPEELPLPTGVAGSYSADGSRLAYVPFSNFSQSPARQRGLKHYRGGLASPVWIASLADSSIEKVPRTDSNDSLPMWVGKDVYFLSDRDGPVSLYAYDTQTHQVRLAIPSDGRDIKWASAGPGAIVYEEIGSIHLLDLATGKARRVDIQLAGDFPAVRPGFENVAEQIINVSVSPTGARAAFEAHGEILTVPAEHGDVRNLTRSPAAADRDPAWSPDGKWIASFSDSEGEYALMIRPQDGLSPARRIDLGAPSFFYSPVWSPDSKKIAYQDKRLNLWYVAVDGGRPVKVDVTAYDGPPGFAPAWSPDSRWLAYARQLPTGLHGVFIYSLEDKRVHPVANGMSDAAFPAFDRNGKYLYFTASTDAGPTYAASMGSYKLAVTRAGYLVVLAKGQRSPLTPQSDEEKVKSGDKKEAAECQEKEDQKDGEGDKKEKAGKEPEVPVVKIDFDDIDQRIVSLPFTARNYAGLVAGDAHELFLLVAPVIDEGDPLGRLSVEKFDLCTKKTEKLLSDVGTFLVTANGKKVLYEQLPPRDPNAPPPPGGGAAHPGEWFIKPIAALGKPSEPGKPDGKLNLSAMQVWVDPRAEWNQMFHETARIERDYFYDPNLHGADLKSLTAEYQPYVDGVMSRADLTYLLADMLGEITAQHVYLGGGNLPKTKHVAGGLLGADYRIDHGRYRIARVYRGENWNPGLRAPLTEPGVDVHEGDYVLAINGRELTGTDEIHAFLQETAGKAVQLVVSTDPAGAKARRVMVYPIADEHGLRLRAWMEENRRKVDQLSGGKVAYVYLPDTAVDGYTYFNRYYFAQSDKAAALIDERFNGGGWIADYIVDWLARPRLLTAMTREGRDQDIPLSIHGPKVMLINEHAGSGGDALPWMFRRLGLGPLIGTRTWGGLIGIGDYPALMDGGFITAPRWAIFNPDAGAFDVENKGVSPDIEVELNPALWRQGKDPQLEAGVATVLDLLKKHPAPPAKRPPYPLYNWPKVRAEQAKALDGQ